MTQSTSNIFLVRPLQFSFNTETADSNFFQKNDIDKDPLFHQKKALDEFDFFATSLKNKGINVLIFEDNELPKKPDAVFPNNWISLHADGTIILYPMYAPNRRQERRQDIIDEIKEKFIVESIIDLTRYEKENKFLEGTGSIVFDHRNKTAYACLSPRTNQEIFLKVCKKLRYSPISFQAFDKNGKEIYHTNVMMSIAEKFSVICLESIINDQEKETVVQSLLKNGHQIVEISHEQMNQFAGNVLALKTNEDKNILVLSQSAFTILTIGQKKDIRQYCQLVPLPTGTIEKIGGGSTRCMIAEIFLPLKK